MQMYDEHFCYLTIFVKHFTVDLTTQLYCTQPDCIQLISQEAF